MTLLDFVSWFSQQNPIIVWTFTGIVYVFLGWAIIELARGRKQED